MSERQWSEALIGRALSNQLLNRKCIVLVPNTTWTGSECDVLGVTMDRRLIDVEVKISRADLKRDAGKGKWWHRPWNSLFEFGNHMGPPAPDVPLLWPRKIWKHYYAVPREIWKPELLECLPSPASGVLLLSQGGGFDKFGNPWLTVRVERRAAPARDADRISLDDVLDVARLANLRMWEMAAEVHKRHASEAEIA